MVEAAAPVDDEVCLARVELGGPSCRQRRSEAEGSPRKGQRQPPRVRMGRAPIDPDAEIWQNSKRPSKTGQSSPTLTALCEARRSRSYRSKLAKHKSRLTSLQFSQVVLHVVRADSADEVNVVIAVEASQFRVVDQRRPLHATGTRHELHGGRKMLE